MFDSEPGPAIKKDIHALLDEPIEGDDKSHRPRNEQQSKQQPKKPDIKSMLEAAKRAKEAASKQVGGLTAARGEDDFEIPSDIPRHHFELEDSQAFFNMDPSSNKQQTQQPKQPQALQKPQHPQPQPQPQAQPPGLPFLGALPTSRSWYYMDPKGNEQGPFSSVQMEKWLNAKYVVLSHHFINVLRYFTVELEVRLADDTQYLPLVGHFIREQRNPFSGVPLQQWFAAPVLTEFQSAALQV